jgi:hypothetical protein
MLLHSLPRKTSVLPWLALGPITGPLAWRMYCHAAKGDHLLAALYGAAIVMFWIAVGATSGQAFAAL